MCFKSPKPPTPPPLAPAPPAPPKPEAPTPAPAPLQPAGSEPTVKANRSKFDRSSDRATPMKRLKVPLNTGGSGGMNL